MDTGSSHGRSEDPGITVLGQKQAECLANFIQGRHQLLPANPYDETNGHGIALTTIYTSLMTRAILTANAVAEIIDLPIYGWVDLHEGGGIYLYDDDTGVPRGLPGKTPDELIQLSSKLVLPEVNPLGWWNRSFEERPERLLRGKRVLQAIMEKHGNTDDRVAIFSHAAFYNYFMTAIFGLEERPTVWFYMNNTGITRIDIDGEDITVVYTNRTEHLPAELLT